MTRRRGAIKLIQGKCQSCNMPRDIDSKRNMCAECWSVDWHELEEVKERQQQRGTSNERQRQA